MLRKILLTAFSALVLCSQPALAQPYTSEITGQPLVNRPLVVNNPLNYTTDSSSSLISQPVGKKFYDIAYEMAKSQDVIGRPLEEAIVFLKAAMSLDPEAKEIRHLLIELACRQQQQNNSSMVLNLLTEYVDENADLDVVENAVKYLLSKLNSREEREKLLEQLLGALGNKNIILSSDLAIALGSLKAEKADKETALHYFVQAYRSNRYNSTAFMKLAELAPEQIVPATFIERLRLALRENPTDIEVAIAFAQHMEKTQLYDIAAGGYGYCAGLYAYLYPSEPLPIRIYLPWAICCYNSEKYVPKCIDILRSVQQSNRFDLRLEAIAGKAAIKMQNGELATNILSNAEKRAEQILVSSQTGTITAAVLPAGSPPLRSEQLAWFYCFALPMPEKAVIWAHRAFSAEPNSPVIASILAYALTTDNQIEWARHLVENFPKNQISELTLAQIQLSEGKKELAIETLKSTIARDPGSFAAEHAKQILIEQGQIYELPEDSQNTLNMLERAFGESLAPVFTDPEKAILVQFNIQGNEFQYGTEFEGVVTIRNNSLEPLVISNNSMFQGNIRVDAQISGDINKQIPKLISERIRTTFLIEPTRSIRVPLRLITGELRKTILMHPQASLEIEFTLYLDPVTGKDGKITNRLTHLQPVKTQMRRPRIEITDSFLRNRLNSISSGQPGQKIKIAQLFVGLLLEQNAISRGTTTYRFVNSDRMISLLKGTLTDQYGLLRNPAPDEWVVKIYTMAEMLDLPLDQELIGAAAENLGDDKWPVRLMVINLLAKNPQSNFNQVLDWMSKQDSNRNVRDMAAVLSKYLSKSDTYPNN